MNNSFASVASIAAFIFSFLGMLMLYPKIIQWINGVILKRIEGNGVLYVIINNLKTSKILMTNISLLIIASTALTIIFTISDSVHNGVVGIYKDLNYDVSCSHIGSNCGKTGTVFSTEDLVDEIQALNYIDSKMIVKDYSVSGSLDGNTYWINGIDTGCYDSYNTYIDFKSGNIKDAYDVLKKI